ncbi:hypothetical protein M8J76_008724 [Diaphorina citri]|nr:hypothetical protein M8J76_008724 [Diaphorina citri]
MKSSLLSLTTISLVLILLIEDSGAARAGGRGGCPNHQVHEWHMGNDTIKSKMEIDPTTQKDAGYYECQADNQYAIDRRGFRTDF